MAVQSDAPPWQPRAVHPAVQSDASLMAARVMLRVMLPQSDAPHGSHVLSMLPCRVDCKVSPLLFPRITKIRNQSCTANK